MACNSVLVHKCLHLRCSSNRSVAKNTPADAAETGLSPALGRSPGEGDGNHSRILAWEIPWTEEPGGLQSVGSQRVGHDWATNKDLIGASQVAVAVKNPAQEMQETVVQSLSQEDRLG